MIPISSQSPALPSHNNLNYELLSLTAIFGEVPCGCSARLTASESYRKKSRHVLDARQTPAPLFQSSPSRLSARCSRKTTVIAARARALCILFIRMQRHECHQVGSSAPSSAAPYRTDLCSHRRVPQLQAPDCHNQSDIGTDEEPTRFRAFTHLWARPRTLCTDSLFWQGYAESQCSRNEKHGQRAF